MSEDKNVYKDSLNLPKTSFDMKAGLVAKEPLIQQRWKKDDLYGQIRKAREGAERFILHDGPPYANGNIHMGTALNKVLKDLVVRIKNMTGFDSPYVPGWDCHGLPIEQKVADNLGSAAATMTPLDIRLRCKEYAAKFVTLQSEQFQRLGVMGEFDNPYITMNPKYEQSVLEVFARLVENGLVYKQLKPVHWSIENRTALADAELEYKDRQDTSVYVGFALDAASAAQVPHGEGDKVYLLIWTTTPWTLPANLAVAVHPDITYSCVHLDTTEGPITLVIADGRVETVLKGLAARRGEWLKSHKVAGQILGRQLVDNKLSYEHPLVPHKACPVVAAPYVTLEDGTGLVHTAPGHGIEDYGTALKCGLEIYCPVLANGTFDDTAPDWLRGVHVWKANGKVVDFLAGQHRLMMKETITHSYPHDWRSKGPTIFRATEQWFIAVDRPIAGRAVSLRKLALDTVAQDAAQSTVEAVAHKVVQNTAPTDAGGVTFIPAWGRNRMTGMLQSRPDWCISRQRAWGLPIPAFYNAQGKPLMTPATVRAVAKVVGAQGSDAWFRLSPRELLAGYDIDRDPAVKDPAEFPLEALTAGKDIFDVWFDSGASWFAVAVARGLVDDIPVDLYLEGADQHRGWFQLSLLPALGARALPPFKTVLTHGYVVDEEGRTKMSKSLGNTMNVVDQLAKRGADVLRLWVASQNYQDDIRCGEGLIAQAEDSYRKIRNTLRFCMGSCADFDPKHHAAEPADHSVDKWMRMQLHMLIRDVREAFDAYEFHKATRLMYEFCTVQASSIYMSAVKDRLYCESPNANRRRATQTVIHEVLLALVKLMAPILPHTCEEAWEHIPFRPAEEPHSVHLAALPDYDPEIAGADTIAPVTPDSCTASHDQLQPGPGWVWDRLMELRAAGLVKLEALKNAGVKNSLDAEVVFKVHKGNADAMEMIEDYHKELEDLLGVGCARIEAVDDLPEGVAVDVEVFDAREKYKRCARSWKRRPDVGSDAEYPELCARDAAVMRELKERS